MSDSTGPQLGVRCVVTAARSPGCGGVTETQACTICRSAARQALTGCPPSSPTRHAPVDAASNSTPTPSTSLNAGAIVNATTDTPRLRATRCSPTLVASRYTRSRSASNARIVARSGLPHIRTHDLRHTQPAGQAPRDDSRNAWIPHKRCHASGTGNCPRLLATGSSLVSCGMALAGNAAMTSTPLPTICDRRACRQTIQSGRGRNAPLLSSGGTTSS